MQTIEAGKGGPSNLDDEAHQCGHLVMPGDAVDPDMKMTSSLSAGVDATAKAVSLCAVAILGSAP